MASGQICSGSASKTLMYMAITGAGGLVFAKLDGLWNKMGMISDNMNRLSAEVETLYRSTHNFDKLVAGQYRDWKVQMEELNRLSSKIGDIESAIMDLSISQKNGAHTFRELVRTLKVELGKNAAKPDQGSYQHLTLSGKLSGYAVKTAVVLALAALGYGFLHMKGITISDILGGTKRSVARALSNVTNSLAQKSSALTDKITHLTEKINNYGKLNEPQEREGSLMQMKNEDGTEASTMYLDQDETDHLLTLVMEEGGSDFDEDFLGNFFDCLNKDPVAARGFLYMTSSMRMKMLSDYYEANDSLRLNKQCQP